jgi:pimeloyl-ACP methyl ester carboxylesterase
MREREPTPPAGFKVPKTGPGPTTSGRRWRRNILRIVAATALALAALPMVPLVFLTVIGETRSGRLVGLSAALVLAALADLARLLRYPPERLGTAWVAPVALVALALVGLLAARRPTAPLDQTSTSPGLHSYVAGAAASDRVPGSEILPESDVLKLGAAIVSRLVPGMNAEERLRVRSTLHSIDRDLGSDPSSSNLPSMTGVALTGLLGLDDGAGHYYAYVPPHEPGERLPAIVFLHGNAGNFKVMPWAWKPFADARKLIIVAPTHGFGFWVPSSVPVVERVRADAVARLPIDPSLVWLAGLSDGGKGVTRVATHAPERYRGLIYLSPTMIADELADPGFAASWKGRPVAVIHGGRDRNVSPATVARGVEILREHGVAVEPTVMPEEDHFLFFARRAVVFDLLAAWLDAQGR